MVDVEDPKAYECCTEFLLPPRENKIFLNVYNYILNTLRPHVKLSFPTKLVRIQMTKMTIRMFMSLKRA
jgi:hypothetical protein